MIVSFLEHPTIGTQQFALVVADEKIAPEVLYSATLDQLRALSPRVDGILVPYGVSDPEVVYSFRVFFEHIRLHFDPDLGSVPVLVIGNGVLDDDNADNYYALAHLDLGIEFLETLPGDIGESLSPPNTIRQEAFIASIANLPDRTGDSHDLANRWGAYTLLHALNSLPTEADALSQMSTLANGLSEDRYYKKLIRGSTGMTPSSDAIEHLNRLRSAWTSIISSAGRPINILVVEDDLGLGWRSAYQLFLGDVSMQTATTYEEAKKQYRHDIDLILLDIRLRGTAGGDAGAVRANEVGKLPGILLAKFFREKGYRGPIVAATASTKAHTLAALLDFQINGYWTKPHPDSTVLPEQFVESTANLYAILSHSVGWALSTRKWIDDVYAIARAAALGSHISVGAELNRKAQAFHALFYQEFSHASEDLSKGLQFDLGYLILFSMVNELVLWPCAWIDVGENRKQLIFGTGSSKKCLLTFVQDKKGNDTASTYTFDSTIAAELGFERDTVRGHFPEVKAFRAVLHLAGLIDEADRFTSIASKRNKLTLTHGKVEKAASRNHATALAEDITKVLQIFQSLADALK